jgi:hypothetical protein
MPLTRQTARVIGRKMRNVNRSSIEFETADVKRWLLRLWHKSLAQSEKSRGWTAFSNLSKGSRKKAAYTAARRVVFNVAESSRQIKMLKRRAYIPQIHWFSHGFLVGFKSYNC